MAAGADAEVAVGAVIEDTREDIEDEAAGGRRAVEVGVDGRRPLDLDPAGRRLLGGSFWKSFNACVSRRA